MKERIFTILSALALAGFVGGGMKAILWGGWEAVVVSTIAGAIGTILLVRWGMEDGVATRVLLSADQTMKMTVDTAAKLEALELRVREAEARTSTLAMQRLR